MAEDQTSQTSGRRGASREPVLWGVLAVLAVAGLSNVLVVISLFLIVPGIILLLAPNLLLYGAPLRIAFWLVRRARIYVLAAAVLALAGALAVGPPLQVNARLKADAASIATEDFDKFTPGMPRPRTIALEIEALADCAEVCRKLLGQGLVDRVVTPIVERRDEPLSGMKAVFSLADASACQGESAKQQVAGDIQAGCILRTLERDPKIDLLMRVTRPEAYQRGREMDRKRMSVSSLGRQSVEILEAWPCGDVDACAPMARRAYVRQDRMVAPLILLLDNNDYGIDLHRAWARIPTGVIADPVAFLASKWSPSRKGLDASNLGIVIDTSGAPVEDVARDPEALRLTIQRIAHGSGPLKTADTALLRHLFDAPPAKQTLNSDLAFRPEAVQAVKDQLGDLLISLRGQESSMLWLTQELIASLPEDDYRRLRPTLMRWLSAPGPLTGGSDSTHFLVRLSELGPVIVEPLIEGMFRPETPMTLDNSSYGRNATVIALCLVGDTKAIPVLRQRKDAIKDPTYKAAELRALTTALDRIEGRAPKEACLKLLPTQSNLDKVWNQRFAP